MKYRIKFNINVTKGVFRGKKNTTTTEVKITTGSFSNRRLLEESFSMVESELNINECRFQKDGVDVKRKDINNFINKYLDFDYVEHYHFAKVETYTRRKELNQIVVVENCLYFIER